MLRHHEVYMRQKCCYDFIHDFEMEWSYKMAVISYKLLQMILYYRITQTNERMNERINESTKQSISESINQQCILYLYHFISAMYHH